jgi:hypothetical protein
MDLSTLDPIAVAAAAVASFAFGALFYTIAGLPWRVALGKSKEEVDAIMKPPVYARAAVGQVILAGALSLLAGHDPTIAGAMNMAFVLWLGVVMSTMMINHGFQGHGRDLTIIDGAHWLGALTIQAIVLGLI